MEFLNQLQQLLSAVFAALFIYVRDVWQWWLAQILSVPWGRVGELPGSKVLLLIASAGIVAYFLFRAVRELYAAGEKAFSAFLTLLRVLAAVACGSSSRRSRPVQDSPAHLVRGSRSRCGSLGCESCTIVSVAGARYCNPMCFWVALFFDFSQSLRCR